MFQQVRGGIMGARVAIVSADDFSPAAIQEKTRSLIELLGGTEKILPENTRRVLLKPNLVMAAAWDTTAVTTSPHVVTALARIFQETGAEVVVAEGASGDTSEFVFEKLGWYERARNLGVALIDCKGSEGIEVPIPEGKVIHSVRVPKAVTECDFVVSVAKMKTHCETQATFSLKNMKGIMSSDRERKEMHFTDINETLVDLNTVFKPRLAIVEGLYALEGIGPGPTGKPFKLGVLVGGLDAVAVDAVCAGIMGFEPGEVSHIALAARRGLGVADLSAVDIVGKKIEELQARSAERPSTSLEGLLPGTRVLVVKGNPCSNCAMVLAACLSSLVPAQVSRECLENGCPIDILVGPQAVPPPGPGRTQVAVGTCLERYSGEMAYSPGCPPWAKETARIIASACKRN